MNEAWTKDPFVRKNLRSALIALGLFILIYAALNLLFRKEFDALMSGALETLGVAWVAALLMISEPFISPIPPDVALVALSKSKMNGDWFPIVSLFGLASFLGGQITYFLGTYIGIKLRIAARVYRRRPEVLRFLQKHGALGVVVGALTPVPFGLTCWLAGAIHLKWKVFFMASLCRPMRFFLYYFLISSADKWLNGGG